MRRGTCLKFKNFLGYPFSAYCKHSAMTMTMTFRNCTYVYLKFIYKLFYFEIVGEPITHIDNLHL